MSLVHVAGHPALDFLGTVSERGTSDQEEFLEPSDLAHWFVDAGYVSHPPTVTQQDLARATELREHLYVVLSRWMDGRRIPDRARSAVNDATQADPPHPVLHRDGAISVHGSVSACLSAVARSALELMAAVPPAQVRWCADDSCTHPFLDTSRAQARRWCDMATCGTRNKQREFRARQHTS
jgi:predicted RNA-binding Zn ribbon-like protein